MSHVTTIQTQIRDIAALRAACAELGVGQGVGRITAPRQGHADFPQSGHAANGVACIRVVQ